MSNKTVTVIVGGGAGTGKSTIASVIAEALAGRGIPFSVNLLDGELPDRENTVRRVTSLKDFGIEVDVVEKQFPREGIIKDD